MTRRCRGSASGPRTRPEDLSGPASKATTVPRPSADVAAQSTRRDAVSRSLPFQDQGAWPCTTRVSRSEEHTSEPQSLMRKTYAVICLKRNKRINNIKLTQHMKEKTSI